MITRSNGHNFMIILSMVFLFDLANQKLCYIAVMLELKILALIKDQLLIGKAI